MRIIRTHKYFLHSFRSDLFYLLNVALLHLITPGWTPLDEGSARRRGLCLHNTQHSQETNTHALGGIRTRNPSKRAAETYALDRAAIATHK